jgi:hypothetical protein
MSKREGKPPVVTRETAKDKYTSTLYGRKESVKRCISCGTVKNIVEFYRAAKRDSKSCNDTRDKCITCWDEETLTNRMRSRGIQHNGVKLPI